MKESSRPGTAQGRRGRPAGASVHPERILSAATSCFIESGYEGATMRAIAARAGCDPALLHYFFSTKARLFAAAVKLPASPATVVEHALSGGVDGIGERLATAMIERLDSLDSHDPLLAVVRSAAGHEYAARMLREYLTTEALAPLATALDADHPQLRASLAGSQIIGFVMARYVVGLEPLASADRAVAARCLGESLQRCLTDRLPLDPAQTSVGVRELTLGDQPRR